MLTPEAVQAHLDSLTKPPGSLGRLEDLAARLCRIQQTLRPATRPRRLVLFAADHGVVEEGVTAWGAEVTELMVRNIVGGGAASSVLARATGTDLRLIDVGSLAGALPESTAYACRKVRAGTRNLAREPALTTDEFGRAVDIGRDEARAAAADGVRVVAAGEMGIGNTTPASCLTALLAGAAAEECVGRGAGIGDEALGRKLAVVSRAVDAARARLGADPVGAMASVGGLEIAAIAGFFAEAAEIGLTVVLDGFVATAGALDRRTAPGGHRDEPDRGPPVGRAGTRPGPGRARPGPLPRHLADAARRGDRGAPADAAARRGGGGRRRDGHPLRRGDPAR